MAKTTMQICISVPLDLAPRLDRVVASVGCSRSWMASRVLSQWLDALDRDAAAAMAAETRAAFAAAMVPAMAWPPPSSEKSGLPAELVDVDG